MACTVSRGHTIGEGPFAAGLRAADLGEQVLHVDAGADEEVAEGEGDEGERDGGGQVRAAVLGQELLGLLRPRLLLLPLAPLLFLLGAEHLQARTTQFVQLTSHVLALLRRLKPEGKGWLPPGRLLSRGRTRARTSR